MAYTLNLKTIGFLLILLNHYDCLPATGQSDSSVQQLFQIPDISSQYMSKSPRQILIEFGNNIDKLFKLLKLPPQTCQYINNVLNEAQENVGQFSSTAQIPYIKQAADAFLMILQAVIAQTSQCSPDYLLQVYTRLLQQILGDKLQLKGDVLSGDDISTICLKIVGSSGAADYLDTPLSEILQQILQQNQIVNG